MTDEELVSTFADTIRSQMRSHGVEFRDDVGERIPAGSVLEDSIVRHTARNLAQVVVNDQRCQTAVGSSPA